MAATNQNSNEDNIVTITGDTFRNSVIDAKGQNVVEFMSYGCPHCHELEPVLQEVAQTIEPNQKLYRVDVAVDTDLAESFNIEGTPTLVMFRDGAEVGRVEGPPPDLSRLVAVVTEPYNS